MSRGLGEILVKIGVIDQVQLAAGLSRTEQWGGSLLSHLVQARMVSEEVLVDALAQRFRYEAAHPLPLLIESSVLALLPGEFCHRFVVLPVGLRADDSLLLAMSDPSDLGTLDAVRGKVRRQVTVVVAGPKAISDAIQSHYFGAATRAGTPDPFSAGADSFGTPGLLSPVASAQGSASAEIELPEGMLEPFDLEPVGGCQFGGDFLQPDQVAPRTITGSGFLSDEAQTVDVGDIFADHAALQSPPLGTAQGSPPLAQAGAPADDVATDEPDRSALDLLRQPPAAPRGNEMPTGELPMQSGDMPRAVHATEGSFVVVAAEAVSERAAQRMAAQKAAVALARAAADEATDTAKPSPSATVVFGSPVPGAPGNRPQPTPRTGGSEADKAIADARTVSPKPPPAPDVSGVLAARCESLELRLALLTDLLIARGVVDADEV